MFGYIAVNRNALSEEARVRYDSYYCGLCHCLDQRFGSMGSATLSYDMTFVALLLSGLYDLEETSGSARCATKPFKLHPYIVTEATDYASDMNMILAYYKCLDDWNDDKSSMQLRNSEKIARVLPGIKERNPRQCIMIESTLEALNDMEYHNELNPDIPANCFGALMGELLIWRNDEYSIPLRRMGEALGRFIYIMDAVSDLKEDLKKQRYNPLIAQMDTDYTGMLTMMMAECTSAYDALPMQRDQDIMQNVLFSGMWQKYRMQPSKEAHDAGPV